MTCRELDEFLADYVAGELAPAVRAEFERHLAICPTCVTYLDTYRRTIRLARSAGDAAVGSEVPAELVDSIVAALRRR